MATVALCPRCSDDLLIPAGTDPNAWAQCPACNVLFQVKDAISRQMTELRLVEPVPESAAVNLGEARQERAQGEHQSLKPFRIKPIASQQTVGDVESLDSGDNVPLVGATISEDVVPTRSPKRSAPTIEDIVKSSAPTWEERAVEGDVGSPRDAEPTMSADADAGKGPSLASAKTIEDVSLSHADSPAMLGGTIEISGDPSQADSADFELTTPSELLASQPTWDDSEHMERLLTGNIEEDDYDVQQTLDAPLAPSEDEVTIENESEFAPVGDTLVNADFMMPPVGAPRRRRSPVRMLVGVVLSGMIGLVLGAVALLWLRGPDGDLFKIARYLPKAVLPPDYPELPREAGLAGGAPRNETPDGQQVAFIDEGNVPRAGDPAAPEVVPLAKPAEPNTFEMPAAAPLELAGRKLVINVPAFTTGELEDALQAATVAQPDLIKGDADDDGAAVRGAKGFSFWKLCDLADKVTFVDATSPDEVAAAQSKADDLFRQTLADMHTRGEIARIIPRWLDFDENNHGVFFAGTISNQSPKGSVIECQADLGAGGEPLTILVPQRLAGVLSQTSRPVGIVGSIIEGPNPHVVGYEGSAPRAVWVSRFIALE